MKKTDRDPDKPIINPEIEGIRVNKYLANAGICSRREADQLVEDGCVLINQEKAVQGSRVKRGDKVEVKGKLVNGKKTRPVYIAVNKPRGIVSTTDPRDKNNIVDFLGYPERIFPIGRLDKDSEGLLLLTNDGDIVNRILRARYKHEKEYLVKVNRPFDQEFIYAMEHGVHVLGQVTLPARLKRVDQLSFRLVLTQGLNRQIRRMCEALGYEVRSLKRLRIMNVSLGNLKPGQWRYLSKKEFAQMEELLDRARGLADSGQNAPYEAWED